MAISTLTQTTARFQGRGADDIYLLARDHEESERLNTQHRISVENLGYIIYPDALHRLPTGCRIADVATGTGAWALGAAGLLPPESWIDGYDISGDQFPAKAPSNVSFSTHNAKLPFPQTLQGTYDLVHVRALVAALDPADWKVVLENLVALLKPGGTLQWTEGDISRLRALRSAGSFSKPLVATPRLLNAFHSIASERTAYGIEELPALFQEASLQSVEIDTISSDRVPSTRTEFARMYATAIFGWARANMPGLTQDDLKQWKADVDKEIDDGAYIRGDTVTFVGVKKTSLE